MSGPRGAPRFEQSRHHVSGTLSVTGSLIVSGSTYLTGTIWMSGTIWANEGLVNETTGTNHYWADGTNGSDLNSGTSSMTPKQSLAHVFAMVPDYIRHDTYIHLTGNFLEAATLCFDRYIDHAKTLTIDGGPNFITVASNGGNFWVADITSTGTIGVGGVGWQEDLYNGYIVQLEGGSFSKHHRLIVKNTPDEIIPVRDWNDDVGAGTVNFKIVRPSTTINAASIIFKKHGEGSLRIQSLSVTGSNSFIKVDCGDSLSTGSVIFSHFLNGSTIENQTWVGGDVRFYTTASLGITASLANSINTASQCGYSCWGSSFTNGKFSSFGGQLDISACYIKTLLHHSYDSHFLLRDGTRVDKLYKLGSKSDITETIINNISSSLGHAITRIGSGSDGNAITLKDSYLVIGDGVLISACSNHAIESENSRLILNGNISGSGYGDFSIYAHTNSKINIKNASTPIFYGTKGYITIDGVVQATDFNTVDGGISYTDMTDGIYIKEINI